MAKKKKKAGMTTFTWIMVAVLAVGLILSVVGIFTDFIKVDSDVILAGESSEGLTLQELFEKQKDMQEIKEDAKIEYFDATYALAWITMIAAAAAFGCLLLGGLLRMNLLKTLAMIAGIVALVAGILTIIFTSKLCEAYVGLDLIVASAKTNIATGCYLTMIGGIVSGAGAVLGGVKK